MAEDNGNGRVTLAVIQRDIQHLTELLEHHISSSTACHLDHEQRLRCLENWKPRVEVEQNTRTGLLAAFTVITTAIGSLIAGFK